jgi:hypothetical protein
MSEQKPWHDAVSLPQPRGIYVASRASVPERSAMWRKLRASGLPIVSSWIDEAGPGETEDLAELWSRIDREIRSADRLVLYVEKDDLPLKGALVEVGMALAMGKPVFIVAPDVELEPRSMRPLGSWAKFRLVTFCSTVKEACGAASLPVDRGAPNEREKGKMREIQSDYWRAHRTFETIMHLLSGPAPMVEHAMDKASEYAAYFKTEHAKLEAAAASRVTKEGRERHPTMQFRKREALNG